MVKAGDTLGVYRIVSSLGTGGMGEVWLAEHELLGRRVAIKVLRHEVCERADIVERFFDEARAASQVVDPGIVQVLDYRREGSAYIVMEYLIGESLSARLARSGRLPVTIAARLVRQAALTMAVAHDAGILHRDLKPDNLFVTLDPAVIGGERLKILDFGIAKLLLDHDHATRTQSGAILGTPMYMSPEQCRDAARVDHRTDIYSLGCVLYQLVVGRPPFRGSSSGDLIAAHLTDAVPLPSAAGVPELDGIVGRCLAKSPDQRYGSMRELAQALAAFAGVSSEIAVPRVDASPPSSTAIGYLTTLATGAGERQILPVRQSRARAWLAVGLATAMAIGIVAFVASRAESSEQPARLVIPPPTTIPVPRIETVAPTDAAIEAAIVDAPPAPVPVKIAKPAPKPAVTPRPTAPPPVKTSVEDLYDNRSD